MFAPMTRVIHRLSAAALVVLMAAPASLVAQEKIDEAGIEKIKAEGLQRSQVMETASWLTDVFGARLTGSPNIKAAGEWAAKKLTEWGMVNAKLEPWGYFGRGWTNERLSLHVIEPTPWPVIAYAAAWTPGTNGTVTGEVVRVQADSAKDLERYRGKLRNAFVMLVAARQLNPKFTADAERYTQAELDSIGALGPPAPRGGGAGGGRAGGGGRGGAPGVPSFTQVRAQFLADEGVAAIIQPGSGNSSMGTVFTGATGSRDPQNPTRTASLILAPEHYNRIARIIEKGTPVRMEANVKNTFYDRDLNAFNIVAEIPGTDPQLKDELVMLGAHFDSWQAGTGATDNAAGSAVMMEALRILKATGLPMKRTVRIGLWSGEEQGLLGSRAYVRSTFGSPTDTTAPLKPAYDKFSGYFNVDNGTGKIRGVYLQGNAEVGPIFTEWMKPFNSLGTGTVTIRNTGGTDHGSFDNVGLPGWQFIQDEVEYGSRTHHSNMDVYDRLVADDMKHNATVVAAFVYLAANRDAKLPRKPRAVQ